MYHCTKLYATLRLGTRCCFNIAQWFRLLVQIAIKLDIAHVPDSFGTIIFKTYLIHNY